MNISYLSLSDKRCTVQFHGCNFRCRGCFTSQKLNKFIKIGPEKLYSYIEKLEKPDIEEIMLAGGEPTLYRKGLLAFIKRCDKRVVLSTNGYLLDADYIRDLKKSGLEEVHIDLKAHSEALHKWYTEKSNERVLRSIELLSKSNLEPEVVTVFIPGIVDMDEIERISDFLSGIDKIRYRIIRYVPVGDLSRRPTEDEITEAVLIAKKYLQDVTSSVEWRRHTVKRKVVWLD